MMHIVKLKSWDISLFLICCSSFQLIVYSFGHNSLLIRNNLQRNNNYYNDDFSSYNGIDKRKQNNFKNHIKSIDILSNLKYNGNTERCMLKKEKTFDFPESISKGAPPSLSEIQKQQQSQSEAWIARIILVTVSAFYGTNFGCVKVLGEALNPGVAAVLRFSIASLVFSPYLFKVALKNKKLVFGGLEIGIYSSIGYWAQAQSLLTSHASTTAFICSLAVIVVPLLNLLFDNKPKSLGSVASSLLPALLAATGVAALELGGTDLPGVGDLWAFLQPLCFGVGFWRIEKHIKMCTEEGDAQAFTGAMMAVVAVFSLVWTSHDFVFPLYSSGGLDDVKEAINMQLVAAQDWHVLAALAWTGIVTTALTSYGENIAMRSLDAAESTVIYSTEPLWGTAFAAVTLGESVGWNTFFGAVLILSACVWSSLGVKVAGILSSSQLVAAEGLEEVAENVTWNWFELITKFQEKVPEL